ncbi:MAG: accessory factor UbiK family protein [Rickettsiales bacterium]
MQNSNKFLNDLSRMASGAVGGLMDVKHEIEIMIETQLEKLLQKMNLVTKEEFDTNNLMLKNLRTQQEEMKKRLEALESQINSLKD